MIVVIELVHQRTIRRNELPWGYDTHVLFSLLNHVPFCVFNPLKALRKIWYRTNSVIVIGYLTLLFAFNAFRERLASGCLDTILAIRRSDCSTCSFFFYGLLAVT
jgi:hypothetical protein